RSRGGGTLGSRAAFFFVRGSTGLRGARVLGVLGRPGLDSRGTGRGRVGEALRPATRLRHRVRAGSLAVSREPGFLRRHGGLLALLVVYLVTRVLLCANLEESSDVAHFLAV